MSKCIHCHETLNIDEAVFRNVETYGRPALVSTKCCKNGIVISRNVSFSVSRYCGERTEDDWGSEIKPLTRRKTQADINEELAFAVLDKFIDNKNVEALDIIRGISNPLTAAWVVQDVLESLDKPSTTQTKNWLINALYNGK